VAGALPAVRELVGGGGLPAVTVVDDAAGVCVRGAAPARRWRCAVMLFQFAVEIAGPVQRAALSGLFGWCDDVAVEHDAVRRRTRIRFDRVAPSLVDAVVSGVRDLDRAGLPARVVVPDDDLVTGPGVAARLGRSRPAGMPALAGGPQPVWQCAGHSLYRWSQVTAWLRLTGDAPGPGPRPQAVTGGPVLDAVNLALRLRAMSPRVERMAAILSLITGAGRVRTGGYHAADEQSAADRDHGRHVRPDPSRSPGGGE
jgi:hypothetical protein